MKMIKILKNTYKKWKISLVTLHQIILINLKIPFQI